MLRYFVYSVVKYHMHASKKVVGKDIFCMYPATSAKSAWRRCWIASNLSDQLLVSGSCSSDRARSLQVHRILQFFHLLLDIAHQTDKKYVYEVLDCRRSKLYNMLHLIVVSTKVRILKVQTILYIYRATTHTLYIPIHSLLSLSQKHTLGQTHMQTPTHRHAPTLTRHSHAYTKAFGREHIHIYK